MDLDLQTAFTTGYERMAAWSDLLDDINLYPVADADTGRNLRISLAPLKNAHHPHIAEQLLSVATGNSGNIAAAFFSKFVLMKKSGDLQPASQSGQQAAWAALLDPQPGTMLTVFDAWEKSIAPIAKPLTRANAHQVITHLKAAVFSTAETLPALQEAGVVDSGALGMFLFFEGFIKQLVQTTPTFYSPSELFGAKLALKETKEKMSSDQGYCIDTTIETGGQAEHMLQKVAALGDSVVALPEGDQLKIHFHTGDGAAAREKLSHLGAVVHWRQEKIEAATPPPTASGIPQPGVHIVTDAAGSLPRKTARHLGITLLDSYLIMGEQHLPETLVEADTLYAAMRRGVKVTTAQASNFERHQSYQSLLNRYEQAIYLCVGSIYTGNYDVARQWQAQHAANGRLTIIDTTAASGRLGLIAMAVARFAQAHPFDKEKILAFAGSAISQCQELIFIDQLKYLAAGGRISKARGFFGDLFNVKPVISPRTQGVEKIGAVKNSAEQHQFAIDYLNRHLDEALPADILLAYTDNQDWVRTTICPAIESRYPRALITVHPMSLTSGVHMGPGTWGVAFLPEVNGFEND